MVDKAQLYPWSSAAARCHIREDTVLDPEWIPPQSSEHWVQWLASENESGVDQRIRERTFTGRPCGANDFVQHAERLLGRQLAPKKPGPKRK